MRDDRALRERAVWAAQRRQMESGGLRHSPLAPPRRRRRPAFELALRAFAAGLRLSGLHARGVANARDVELRELTLRFASLPPAFDGYRIVQLSDLHLDGLSGFGESLARLLLGVRADLFVLTGDYRYDYTGSDLRLREELAGLAPALRAPDGVLAVLGNHDSVELMPLLEGLGARVLVNETVSLERGGARLHVTGVDDAHFYFTHRQVQALREAAPGFRIALAHSAELLRHAAEAGVELYLTGHTHGGQVCLPGGIPVVTHSPVARRHAVGLWRAGAMLGYTSRGAGVSGIPVRFNCRGEVTAFTLRRH